MKEFKMENVGKCKRAELPNQENGQCSAGELTDGELKAVNGGSSMISEVIKNFGGALQSTGRA